MQSFDLNGWLAASALTFLIASVSFAVISVVAWAMLFRKAGEGWWKIFIPVYNVYTMYKISDSVRLFCGMLETTLFLFISTKIITALSAARGTDQDSIFLFFFILALVLIVLEFVLWCWLMVKTAHAFGKSNGFAVGLILLYPVFIMILAFDSSRHIAYDIDVKYGRDLWTCPNCGSENMEARASCSQCGTYR